MSTFTQQLQRELDIVSAILLGEINTMVKPRLLLEDVNTASTDGALWVRLPRKFLGEVVEERPEIGVGLLAHEVGHWMQPLEAVREVEKRTGLAHTIANILLDINNEALVASTFPLFGAPLAAVRETVNRNMAEHYLAGLESAKNFAAAATNALLYARYGNPSQSVSTMNDKRLKQALGKVTHAQKGAIGTTKLLGVLTLSREFANLPTDALPRALEQFATQFPELCQSPTALPVDPMGHDTGASSGGEMIDQVRKHVADATTIVRSGGTSGVEVKTATPQGRAQLSPQVLALSRQMCLRWVSPRGAISLAAPGRLNRLGAVRGEPVPFSQPLPADVRMGERMKVLLAVDWSASMTTGSRWEIAINAARAIALALQDAGADVRALFFAEHAWHAPGYAADALFARSCGIDLSRADGVDTEFRWLPHAWQSLPNHRVILLTDGHGKMPQVAPRSSCRRTSAMLIQCGDETAETAVRKAASHVIKVESLHDLAAVWAYLIPRNWVA